MKNIIKAGLFIFALASLTACDGPGHSGKLDSTANTTNQDSSTVTVDTLPKSDTGHTVTKTDSVKK